MPIFQVKMPCKIYNCCWPKEKDISLADCHFLPGKSDHEFFAQCEVEASDDEEARILGQEICRGSICLLELCVNEQVKLYLGNEFVTEKGSTKGIVTASIKLPQVYLRDMSFSQEQLESIEKARAVIDAKNDEVRNESLRRAIHWYSIGLQETESKIDRFIKFWIATEVIINGNGEDVVQKIKQPLWDLYPTADRKLIKDVVGRIYGTRGKIVHVGVLQPEELDLRLSQLEDIFKDLLRYRLGLIHKSLAKDCFCRA